MSTIYIYALNTMADWEFGFLTAEVNSRRFFKKDADKYKIKFAGNSLETVSTMGGLKVKPEIKAEDISIEAGDVLVLPGADTWNETVHEGILKKAKEFLSCGQTVAGICGATMAMASAGILDERPHSSNGVGFLDMFVPTYKGKEFYKDSLAYADDNLITGSGAGSLYWTKLVLEKMNVMKKETLNAWFDYFSTGKAESFFAMMQSLQ